MKLYPILGDNLLAKMVKVKFSVVDYLSDFNVILGRPYLNAFENIISIDHLVMELLNNHRKIKLVERDPT